MSLKYLILGVDIGTTNLRCCVYDNRVRPFELVSTHGQLLETLQTEPHASEINPDHLWMTFVTVVKTAIEKIPRSVGDKSNLRTMGICMHRNSFSIWPSSGDAEPLRNFMTWADNRASSITNSWNRSFIFKVIHFIFGILYFVTRQNRFLLMKVVQLQGALILPRLIYLLQLDPTLRSGLESGQLEYGCIDSWLLKKLTKDTNMPLVTESSLASGTGMFDPFTGKWAKTALQHVFNIPTRCLPKIDNTSNRFTECDESVFGVRIPVTALMGDQQSAMFGCGNTSVGDVMCSLGTGSFIDMFTDDKPHASLHGLYPLVAWRLNGRDYYLAEGRAHDTATVINWALRVGIIDNLDDSARVAFELDDIDCHPDIFFVPAFGGLQAPYNDHQAAAMFIGLTSRTSKEQMARAVLQSIFFRIYDIYNQLRAETGMTSQSVKICGGVARNDYICQNLAHICRLKVQRIAECQFAASRGIAMMAELAFINTTQIDISSAAIERTFVCDELKSIALHQTYQKWQQAVNRSLKWYTN